MMLWLLNLGCYVLFLWFMLTMHGRRTNSRLVDQLGISPSAVLYFYVGLLTGTQYVVFAADSKTGIAGWQIVLWFINILILAWCVASFVDVIRHPPETEWRPSWYVGEGRPNWKSAGEKASRRDAKSGARFGLGWLIVMVATTCVLVSGMGETIRKAWGDRQTERMVRQTMSRLDVQLTRNRVLDLRARTISDDDLRVLLMKPGIHELDLTDTTITLSAMKLVGSHPELLVLKLAGTSVTDEGAALIRNPQLEILDLRRTKVSPHMARSLETERNLLVLHDAIRRSATPSPASSSPDRPPRSPQAR